jgi:hypothetical protein
MVPTLRRWLLASVLSLLTFAQARGDVICDRLVPFGLLPPTGGFSLGCSHVFNLKLGAALGPDGNYILLSYPSCASGPCAGDTGLTLLQCAATSGYFCCVSTAQTVPTITGTNVGTLVAGLNQRIANDTDTRAAICHEIYTGNGSRVANVPLIQFIGADRTQAQVIGFLQLFLVGPPSGSGTSTTFPVEFISDPTPAHGASWGRLKLLYR